MMKNTNTEKEVTLGKAPLLQEIKGLEKQLSLQTEDLQQLLLIDKLASYYAFTDVRQAQKLLSRQNEILKENNFPDYRFNFHLINAFIENQLYNYRLAEMHYKAALELVEDRGDAKQQAQVYIDYAGLCINVKRLTEAVEYVEKAEKLLIAFPDKLLMVGIICRRGYLHLHYGENAEAIKLFLDGTRILETHTTPLSYREYYLKALIYSGLGTVYERIGNRDKQVKAHLQAANICETMGMRTRLSWHYYLVGTGHLSLGDEEAAEQYFLKSIKIKDDISQQARAGAYASLGMIYSSRKEWKRTNDLYKKAERLYLEKQAESQSNLANIKRLKGNVFKEQGEYDAALREYRKAYEFANKVNDFRLLSSIYHEIANCYSRKGDFKNAFDYQLIYDELNLKHQNQIKEQKISELEIRYDAERARSERELMRLQTVELQGKALRAQMNPHFIFNALNSIQNFISGSEVEGADSAVKFLADFASLMRKSLEYSEKQYISLEEELEFLNKYLQLNAKLRFDDQFTYKMILGDEIEEDIMGVPTMVIQPYIENAIEHGLRAKKDGKILVEFILEDESDAIRCIVQDNGIGRKNRKKQQLQDPQYQNHRSRGTEITEERLRIAHGAKRGNFVNTFDIIENGVLKGTRVEILIPISDIKK